MSNEPSVFRRMIWLSLAVAATPTLLLVALWAGRTLELDPGSIWRIATATAGVAIAVSIPVAWVLGRGLATSLARSVDETRRVFSLAGAGDFGARVPSHGPEELRALSDEVNQLLDQQQLKILDLRLELDQATALRESSRDLIKECIYAREPLAKQHPGLAAAYAEAAIRQAGREGEADPTVDGLVHEMESASAKSKRTRGGLRWTLDNVRVEVPVPSKLVNLSVSGMAIESSRGLPVGGRWVFRIASDALAWEIPGTVRWCRLDRTERIGADVEAVYRTGVSFDQKLAGKAFDTLSPAGLRTG